MKHFVWMLAISIPIFEASDVKSQTYDSDVDLGNIEAIENDIVSSYLNAGITHVREHLINGFGCAAMSS